MFNKIINVNVEKDNISITNEKENFIENSVNYIKLVFNFDEIWNSFEYKYVVFKNNKNKVKCLVGEDNTCYVPGDVIRVPSFSFSLFCENDNQRITTNVLFINVNKTISLDNSKEEKELELLYNQINTLVNFSNDNLNELKEYIKNIKLDVDFSVIINEIDKIKEEIEHLDIDVSVDFTEVINEIVKVENQLSNLDIDVDLSEVLSKLDEIPKNVYSDDLDVIKNKLSTINSYVSILGGMSSSMDNYFNSIMGTLGGVQQQMSTYYSQILNNIHTEVISSEKNIKNKISEVKEIIGDNTKPDNTISNWSYWGLIRCEETKQISQQIYSLLTDADLLIEKI